ncbi:MAG: Gfo/Idh/MocA family oxidoreductase [Lentisphaerae bacterium]|nr:Gfo/Idh/MocA family oxidoreductase [Lentisphaerota bacterium]MBT4816674.1 Gfo/Idh/MocA family oxidoreductase [Lentisphaerota bacterium]MBT5605665.1 Gfo/Idh/MocA family oxidoreductase [Lentisphaerota bacterium]MBT7056316.1 Gfo/Idh/MocA family oxidoreductase [Lentisphaerota bacterium]MBT7843645.1 Gfo/Idh/MocA family oxidoreductase [Lentisphaerota bacterium]
MGMRIGICGVGAFAGCFIPLFKAHPGVDQVILCDLKPDLLEKRSEQFGIPATCPSLDELCQTDVDAIAIITQHHLHAPQAIQALRSGKHVYSAVPSAITMQEVNELVDTVEETGRTYMIGETSYYYPCAVYCRERYRNGDFGHIVTTEAQYYHDYSHGLYEVYKRRLGKDWERQSGIPPMFYPTHSVSLAVSVTGAYATHVCGLGFVDRHEDNLFAREDNVWQNPFSNETMLCKMSDGSMARFSEFRRIGHPGTVGMSMYGTEGSYEENVAGKMWVTKSRETCVDLDEQLACAGVPVGKIEAEMAAITSSDGTHLGASRAHDVSLLPREFVGLPNGHCGSHQFLVHDFITACLTEEMPPNNVWQAARYLVPGLLAHDSAVAGGELLAVPDRGAGPAG